MPAPPDPARFAFANAGRLLSDTFDALLPPNRMSVADHAGRNRWVKSPVGAHLERWSHDTAPYLTEPMHWLSDDQYDTVGIVGPGACGKTMIAENWLLYTAESDPADLLWYLNTDAALDAYVKGRIEPMLDQHDPLLGHLRRGLGRDSVAFKRFRGGRAEFLTFTPSSLVNKHVARIVADEIDNYDESLGDPLALLNPRRQAAGADSKLLVISHPDRGAPIDAPRTKQRGIMAVYADSTRCTWWWRCPHCGTYSSPHPGTSRRMVLDWPKDAPLDEVQAKARLVCPTGCLIEDGERYAMNLTGRWVGEGETIDEDGRVTGERRRVKTAGAWILGVMSPFTKDGIGGLARAQAQAERAADLGDHEGLRQVMVKTFGEDAPAPWSVSTCWSAWRCRCSRRSTRGPAASRAATNSRTGPSLCCSGAAATSARSSSATSISAPAACRPIRCPGARSSPSMPSASAVWNRRWSAAARRQSARRGRGKLSACSSSGARRTGS
ncbi:hypothetical protein GXW78_25670 [Roseomonas terrae]|uniref:Phage terminase large subunit GpA ATPase domain-containing protein n=1 Tax=Neoroseomonas terrae TaxID=424799 RepID=A0ABS5EPY3_9PROT|nr:phage terminase large subunit family protein [Neoroseomonas terrae]MBR0653071.1 hypothetical protein [Neoroseomonas terrae]